MKIISIFNYPPTNMNPDGYTQYPFNPHNLWFVMKGVGPADLVGSPTVEVRSLGRKWVYWRNGPGYTAKRFKRVSRKAWDRFTQKEEIPFDERMKRYKKLVREFKKECKPDNR